MMFTYKETRTFGNIIDEIFQEGGVICLILEIFMLAAPADAHFGRASDPLLV